MDTPSGAGGSTGGTSGGSMGGAGSDTPGGGYQPGSYPSQPPPSYPSGYGPGYQGGPGGYGRPTPPGPPPDNNLVMAIISIFCCWPLAIPAIIFATQVQGKWAMGDFAGAQDSAQKARTFSMIAIILGVVLLVLYLILWLVLGATFFSFWSFNTTVRP